MIRLILLALALVGCGSDATFYQSSCQCATDEKPAAARSFSLAPLSANFFGAVGDGITDDTFHLQCWLNACAGRSGFLPAGRYVSGTLYIDGKTKISGAGSSSSVILARSGLTGAPVLRNACFAGGPNTYANAAISVSDIGFDVACPEEVRCVDLVSFVKVRGLTIHACRFDHAGYIGLAVAGSREVAITGNEFAHCGKPAITTEGGPALWVDNYAGDGSISREVAITGNVFHDNEWSGVYFGGMNSSVSGNTFTDNKEAAIFSQAFRSTISGNVINGVTRKYISACGIETGGAVLTISANHISGVESSCIALTDAQLVTITGNTLANPRQDPTTYPTAGGIAIISTAALNLQPKWITIAGNAIWSNVGVPWSAIDIGASAGAPVEAITITGNSFQTASPFAGGALTIDSGMIGPGFLVSGNNL